MLNFQFMFYKLARKKNVSLCSIQTTTDFFLVKEYLTRPTFLVNGFPCGEMMSLSSKFLRGKKLFFTSMANVRRWDASRNSASTWMCASWNLQKEISRCWSGIDCQCLCQSSSFHHIKIYFPVFSQFCTSPEVNTKMQSVLVISSNFIIFRILLYQLFPSILHPL